VPLAFTTPEIDWAGLSPYLVLFGGAGIALLVTLFVPGPARRPFAAAVAGLSLAGAAAVSIALFVADDTGTGLVADAIRRDRLAEYALILVSIAGLLAVGVSYREPEDRERVGEYYALLLTAVGGMGFLAASNNLISLFLGLELFSICLYVLTAISVGRLTSLEAGLKYLVVGSFGSAVLLFGSAFVYGGSGSIYFGEIAQGAATGTRLFYVAGLAMMLVGLGFKISAAPFHMWTPDVYQGAPTPVTAFMSAATKIAALILTLRLLTTAFPGEVQLWSIALGVIVCASLAWGNLAAIVQSDVKRMLAYSSISHAGFLLMPVAAGNELGGAALLYYLIPYGALSMGCFAIVAARERELDRAVTMSELSGLGWERPYLGGALATFMFGFIGLPPAGIFLGKFYGFASVIDRGWTWLAIVGAVFTAVSIAYYGGVVRALYMSAPRTALAPVGGGSPPRDLLLGGAIAICLLIGIGSLFAADPLLDVVGNAVADLPFPK
jgi:NADH-quinone oxidoreductase subunit N